MTRLFRLAIAMLPLALGAAAAGAQESSRPQQGHDAGQRSSGPREVRPRESLMQRGRDRDRERETPPPAPRQQQAEPQRPPAQDSRSISDAVRRVQRSTGGQILGAEQVPFEGRNITRVKYMDDRGRVRYMDYTGDPGTAQRAAPPRRADNDER